MALITGLMRRIGIVVLVLAAFAGACAFAQDERVAAIEAASRDIANLRATVEADEVDNPEILEGRLRDIRSASRLRLSSVERDIEANRAQLELLGPAPAEGEPAESEVIAGERAALLERQARLNGERTRVLANIYESGELLARLSGAQVGALYKGLLERGASPLAPGEWRAAWAGAGQVTARIGVYFQNWADGRRQNGALRTALVAIVAAVAISILMFGPVSRWVAATFSVQTARRQPTRSRRIFVAAMTMVARIAPGVIGGLVIIETLRAFGVLTGEGEQAARAFWLGVLSVLTVSGFAAGVFSPSAPDWRIAPIESRGAKTVARIALAIAVVFALRVLLTAIWDTTGADGALMRMTRSSAAIAIGVLLYAFCRRRWWRVEDAEEAAGNGWRLARRLVRALAIIAIVAGLAGYVALADFIVLRICLLALLLGLAWLMRMMLGETAMRIRAHLSGSEGDTEEARTASENFRFWSRLVIDVLLVLALAPAVLILFGVPVETVRDMAGQALFGFNIGGVQIPSIAKLFSAILVFVIIMALTRLIQTGVKRGPLAHSRADIGVQNSLITLLGYAGMVIALFLGISALGFDLSNLALIAGALSVGIGFGLQSIVNNFVSGLILLFERPIKVGDWIITPSGEGTVKKISVRSTEIETFDRSSIIIPNSELIASPVTNWTHKNKIGRITVPVGVSYGADPELVKATLLKCAREHPKVVAYPEPFVTWMGFGDSSLDFEIRAYLRDISEGLSVRTDLRFAIFKALGEAGVEIPFPQRDVHVKSWPETAPKDRAPDREV